MCSRSDYPPHDDNDCMARGHWDSSGTGDWHCIHERCACLPAAIEDEWTPRLGSLSIVELARVTRHACIMGEQRAGADHSDVLAEAFARGADALSRYLDVPEPDADDF